MPHLDIRYVSREGENPFADIERSFSINDGPSSNNLKIVEYLLAEAAAAGARLIMDGLGGDYTLNPRGNGALAGYVRRGEFRRFYAELRPHLRETGQSPWQMVKSEFIVAVLPRFVIRWTRQIRRSHPTVWSRSAVRDIRGPHVKELVERTAAAGKSGIKPVPFGCQRAQIMLTARRINRGYAAGGAILAAAHSLDLTRPFHDKRVVELALAIPEAFYVKNGRNRHLARLALADIYPPEFQTRGRKNEGVLADETAILNAATPQLVAEAERMAKNARLSVYFDFARIGRLLQAVPNKDRESLLKKSHAVHALMLVRFIEWFSDSNEGRQVD